MQLASQLWKRPRFLLATSILSIVAGSIGAASGDAAQLPDGFVDETIASGLNSPVGLTFLPDGRILVTEQVTGNIVLIPEGASVGTTIFTVPDVEGGGEKGLLGIAVDPNWPSRPYLYVYFDHDSGQEIHIRMYTASGDLTNATSAAVTLSDPYEILTDIPDLFFNHNGGTIRFGPDGMLYAGTGDDSQSCNSQDLSSLSGKILRLNVSSLPGEGAGPPPKSQITPVDNPFPGPDENERLLYSQGLRNPFRFHIDPLTGKLYIGDVGAGNYEELNEAVGGDNFGWPRREGAHDHSSGCPGATAGTDPIAEYDRSGFGASIVGDPLYRLAGTNPFPADYDGDVFYHEYYQGWMRRVTFNETTQEWEAAAPAPGQQSPENWATGYAGVSEMMQGPDGSLYYIRQWANSVGRIRNTNPTTSIPTSTAQKMELHLQPNPINFGQTIEISYALSEAAQVDVSIYDVRGRRVARLVNGVLPAGQQVQTWKVAVSDDAARSGVFFVRMISKGEVVAQKFTTIR